MPIFAVATLTPILLIGLGALQGGVWIGAAVVYLTGLTSILDRWTRVIDPDNEFPTGNGLSILLAIGHFGLLPLVVYALARPDLILLEKAGLFFAAGLYFGQVSNANAHELIHRPTRLLHRLGMWVYITLLFGHHTSAHVLVHHRHVATPQDPNSARSGEGFYRFALRAWIGSLATGYRAEAERLQRINRSGLHHPYIVYVSGALLCLSAAYALGAAKAVVIYILLAGYAQSQLLLSDYVQHYGLRRKTDPSGKPVPVAAQHSWNSPHWFSSVLMLNATRHSDHHAHPARPYPGLTIPKEAPMLPKPLPLMASIALVPPMWRRIMDPQADRWTDA